MKHHFQTVDRPTNRALAGLTIGALMISFSAVWVKISHVTPTASAFYRVFIGGVFLLLVTSWRGEMKRPTRRQSGLVMICGALFALDMVLYHYCIHYIGPGLGTILPNFQVFHLALVGAVLFKEKLGAAYFWAIPLAFAGLFLVVGIEWGRLGGQYRTGVYLGLIASVCYAGFLLSLRKLQADDQQSSFFYVLMIVSLTSAGFLAAEVWRTGDTFAIPGLPSLASLVTLGVCSQGLGWILISNALPHIRLSLSGLILLLQPALAFVWDVLFFSRPTSGLNWIGVVIVLAAIYMGTVGNKPKRD